MMYLAFQFDPGMKSASLIGRYDIAVKAGQACMGAHANLGRDKSHKFTSDWKTVDGFTLGTFSRNGNILGFAGFQKEPDDKTTHH